MPNDELLARMPRHVVTRALGMEESVRVSARWRIEEILSEPRPPEDHVRALIDAALQASAQDNIAVVVTACRATAVAPLRRPSGRPAESTLAVARDALGSAPQIIIVGVETHVVPMESASARRFSMHSRTSRDCANRASRRRVDPKPMRCADCGQPLENRTTKCPTCDSTVRV